MHLVVFSYKPCWPDPSSPSGFATDGGFPLQMKTISELFDRTTLLLPQRGTVAPSGLIPLTGRGLEVETFDEPRSTGLRRKLWWLVAGLGLLPRMWRLARGADAVHAPVPGDVGFLGLLVALLQRKRTFVRHCGTWGNPQTRADRLLHELLVRVAGRRCVVLATGGGPEPPSKAHPAIEWIFSTSLSAREIECASRPQGAEDVAPPRLVSVGRLTRGKNVAATLRALAEVRSKVPGTVLDVLGSGPEESSLRALAEELGVADAVAFRGNVGHDEVLATLCRSSLLVFPTRVAEGFPKAVLESLACGTPVVTPRVSVLPHLLRDGGGVVVGDVAPHTLASAICALLERPDELARHADAGRKAARNLTLEAWRDAIGTCLEKAWGVALRSTSTAEDLAR